MQAPSINRLGRSCRGIARASLLALLAIGGAQADPQDTVVYTAGLSRQYDDNLFRLPGHAAPPVIAGRSSRADTVTTASLGVEFRKAWSLQQLEAGVAIADRRYATYDYLDNETTNANAAWRWQITPRLKGSLLWQRSQTMADFGDYRVYSAPNLRTSTTQRLDASWQATGGWHLRGGLEQARSTNSRTFVEDEGSSVASAELGLRYVFPSANWVDFGMRSGSGEYLGRIPNHASQLDTRFRDRRQEVRAFWQRGKTRLDGSLGHFERAHENFPARDFSGAVGSLRGTWMPTGKLNVTATWRSDLAAYTDLASSYYRQDTLSLAPGWQVSGKLRLGMQVSLGSREFFGPVVPLPIASRHERTRALGVTADWAPHRNLSIGGQLSTDRRTANLPGYDYDATMASINLRVAF